MSIKAPERPTSNQSPVPERPGFIRRHARVIGSAVAGLLLVGTAGGGYLATRGGDKDPQNRGRDQQENHLVLGPDGNPLTYLEWDPETAPDRDLNGKEDNGTDVNKNGTIDSDELYNQITGEFVDPAAGTDEVALAGASEKELSQIAEIEAAFPTIGEAKPHWIAEFLECDPLVQEFMVVRAGQRGAFDNDTDWQTAVLNAMSVTRDEIEDAASTK